METREQFLLRNIRERNEAIGNGGSVENIEKWNREIKSFEEELAGLQQETQELPPEEEVKVEQILTEIYGEPLEYYTETFAGATLIREKVKLMIEFERSVEREKTEVYKKLYQDEILLNDQAQERNRRLEQDYQNVVDSENELQIEISELKLIVSDRDSKLKNATDRIVEIEQELRDALIEVNRSRQFTAKTDEEQTEQIEAAKREIAESIIEVYDTKPKEGEYPSITLVSKLAKTGEEIEYHYFKKNKYKNIGLEAALAMQAMNAELNAPEVDEESIFPETSSGESTSSLDATEDQGEQREALELEPETFEERTERRLNAIEHRLNKNEPEFIHDIAS